MKARPQTRIAVECDERPSHVTLPTALHEPRVACPVRPASPPAPCQIISSNDFLALLTKNTHGPPRPT